MNKDKFLVKDGNRAEWGVPEGYPWKKVDETVIVPETVLSFPEEGSIRAPFIFDPVVGETYSITYNGVIYECIAAEQSIAGSTVVYVGNLALFEGENTGEPFLIISINNQVGIWSANETETDTISIKSIVREVHPMSAEFLPTETWTFTLEDGSTMTKKVAVVE